MTGVVYNEMKWIQSNPMEFIKRLINVQLFNGSGYGYQCGGNSNEIAKSVYDDVISFYKNNYNTPLIYLYGDIEINKVTELINKFCINNYNDFDINFNESFKCSDGEYSYLSESLEKKMFNLFELILAEDKDIELKPINIATVVQEEVLSFYEQVKAKNIDINVLIEEEILIIEGEESSLRRVIENLIANSLKYGKRYIKVKLFKENDIVKLIICNKCSNITPDNIDLIFNRFYMADKESNTTGTGLGLAIVKSLVIKLKGTIRAECINEELRIICEWKLKDKYFFNIKN